MANVIIVALDARYSALSLAMALPSWMCCFTPSFFPRKLSIRLLRRGGWVLADSEHAAVSVAAAIAVWVEFHHRGRRHVRKELDRYSR